MEPTRRERYLKAYYEKKRKRRVCPSCGKKFRSVNALCSECRQKQIRNVFEAVSFSWRSYCSFCGKVYERKNKRQYYCSYECERRAFYERRKKVIERRKYINEIVQERMVSRFADIIVEVVESFANDLRDRTFNEVK